MLAGASCADAKEGEIERTYPRTTAPGALGWLATRYRVRLLARLGGRLAEALRYATVRPTSHCRFVVVSSERNGGPAVLRCLESIHGQDYDPALVEHLLIDDASSDGTDRLIRTWLAEHPGHRVDYLRRERPVGGTVNNLEGFRRAPPGVVVLELNGDDWLPDRRTLAFLDRVYADPEVWTTYNTLRRTDGAIPIQLPPPRSVVRKNLYRRWSWSTTALHTFRSELFARVPPSVMTDPETGRPWEVADDLALYLAMLELSAGHARHLYRITYVYNLRPASDERGNRSRQLEIAERIRARPPLEPLASLEGGERR